MQHSDFLDSIQIAKPCSADWNGMRGGEQVRFCEQCSLNVYNISAMSPADAVALIEKTEGKACLRLYRRKDGTVITMDCPVGVRAAMRRAGIFVTTSLAAVLTLGTSLAFTRGEAAADGSAACADAGSGVAASLVAGGGTVNRAASATAIVKSARGARSARKTPSRTWTQFVIDNLVLVLPDFIVPASWKPKPVIQSTSVMMGSPAPAIDWSSVRSIK